MTEEKRQIEQAKYDQEHSQLDRNKHGQFATPYPLALSIATDALGRLDNPSSFIEPCCGSGAFISAIHTLKPSVSITGIEKDLSVYQIAESLWGDKGIELYNDDFFDWIERAKKYDLLITNPPYTRHHHLSSSEKEHYGYIVKDLTGYRVSQLAGLHAYFILTATLLLKDNGIASWLIPSELFSVNYGKIIKQFVTSDVCVERIHFFDNSDLQFEDALVSSCVLVVRRKGANDDDLVTISQGDFDHPSQARCVRIADLRAIEKWQHFFSTPNSKISNRIGDYFSVKRGLSTGAESFYTREREAWHELGITDAWLTPILPAPRFMADNVIESDSEGWPIGYERALLNIPSDIDESELPGAVRSYLDSCPDKVRNSYTARHRKKWYSVEQRTAPPIVCTYMSRSNEQPFRFVRNKSDAVVTTAYLCLYPKSKLSCFELDELCEQLNSIPPATLISHGREYGGGLRKLEPKELLKVPFDGLH